MISRCKLRVRQEKSFARNQKTKHNTDLRVRKDLRDPKDPKDLRDLRDLTTSNLNIMITGEIKSRIDSIWDTFWTGGITNSITILEQMTYLFFAKMLDDAQRMKEASAIIS